MMNHRLRRVRVGGASVRTVSTLAGGAAGGFRDDASGDAARFDQPAAAALDAATRRARARPRNCPPAAASAAESVRTYGARLLRLRRPLPLVVASSSAGFSACHTVANQETPIRDAGACS